MWFIRLEIPENAYKGQGRAGFWCQVIRQICINIGLLFFLWTDILEVQRKIISLSQ